MLTSLINVNLMRTAECAVARSVKWNFNSESRGTNEIEIL